MLAYRERLVMQQASIRTPTGSGIDAADHRAGFGGGRSDEPLPLRTCFAVWTAAALSGWGLIALLAMVFR